MDKSLIASESIIIKAPATKVWDALTNPESIKKYLFGTEAISDWKKGSALTFKGVWKDKPYEDKGTILEIEPEKVLKYNYWSPFTGSEDKPENYIILTFVLEPNGDETKLTLTQEGAASKDGLDHSMKNWKSVLENIKKLLEA